MVNTDPIFVRIVTKSPVIFHGAASVFEGQFNVDVTRSGVVEKTQTIYVAPGPNNRGEWDCAIKLDPGKYILVFYEPSAKDGSHIHKVKVPIWVLE